MKEAARFAHLYKHFDGVAALDDFSCAISDREILGLLGPNGAGKTTLFNVISGIVPLDTGSTEFNGHPLRGLTPHQIANLGIARTFQQVRLIRQISVIDNVLLAFRHQPGESLWNVFFRPTLCECHIASRIDQALALLTSAGLGDTATDFADKLSYGQQKLLTLVCCLAADAKLLLLDEPVAGIAPEMAERILAIIADLPNQGKSVIIIEHDIEALKRIVHRMIFMDAGQKVCEGTPDEVLRDPCVIEAYLD